MSKGLKTFNLNHSTIRIVRSKPNQSAFVDKAIMKLHNKETEFDITQVETRKMLVEIVKRMDFTDPLRLLLVERINKLA